MKTIRSFLHVIVVLLVTLAVQPSLGQISPGELSRAHASLKGLKNCTRCHSLGKEVDSAKCLECHVSIRERIENKSGYHFSEEVRESLCTACHSEHAGREFELVYWGSRGVRSFDHAAAGWPLEGKHAKADCKECHQPKFIPADFLKREDINPDRTHLGLERQCVSCHLREHGSQVTEDCLNCHGFESWIPASRFDHSKTAFSLTGRHRKIACSKCHPVLPRKITPELSGRFLVSSPDSTTKYSGIIHSSCSVCHEDPHRGKLGSACEECHSTDGFQEVLQDRFDHARTQFPLRGKHSEVACKSCHGARTRILAFKRCMDCHQDAHHAQFVKEKEGPDCDFCHSEDGFVPADYSLQRHQKGNFPLTGSHLAIPCVECHIPVYTEERGKSPLRFTFGQTTCQDCHKDAHNGQLDLWINQKGCEFCHSTETWRKTSFDHNLARFPLEGQHREILCLKCHSIRTNDGERQVWMKPLKRTCNGCHEDPHHGQFADFSHPEEGTDCNRCHSPEDWQPTKFDHNRDSEFHLDGGHEKTACVSCHHLESDERGKNFRRYRPMITACVACHGDNR